MAITTISVRVPEEVKSEVQEFEKDEKLIQMSEAARKLLLMGLESWRKEKALHLFAQGRVTFSKAAQIAKVDAWEFADLIKERKIVWIKNVERLKRDITAAR